MEEVVSSNLTRSTKTIKDSIVTWANSETVLEPIRRFYATIDMLYGARSVSWMTNKFTNVHIRAAAVLLQRAPSTAATIVRASASNHPSPASAVMRSVVSAKRRAQRDK